MVIPGRIALQKVVGRGNWALIAVVLVATLLATACSTAENDEPSGKAVDPSGYTREDLYDPTLPIPSIETDEPLSPMGTVIVIRRLGLLYLNASLATTQVYGVDVAQTDYEEWRGDLDYALALWGKLDGYTEKFGQLLEETEFAAGSSPGDVLSEALASLGPKKAYAYTAEEIAATYDKLPRNVGKARIQQLAEILGTDVKRAQAILNQTSAEISADAYRNEGDSHEKLERGATAIKTASKVVVFAGAVVATGGAAGAVGAVTKGALVVQGADLTLEVVQDTASIAMGSESEKSTIVTGVGALRKYTDPAAQVAGILIMNTNSFGEVGVYAAEQIRSIGQDGKLLGIKLPPPPSGTSREVVLEKLVAEPTPEDASKMVKALGADLKALVDPKSIESLGLELREPGTDWISALEALPIDESDLIVAIEALSAALGAEAAKESPAEADTVPAQSGAVAKASAPAHDLIPIAEFNRRSDDDAAYKTMKLVREAFGEPDLVRQNDKGRPVHLYFDRIEYQGGKAGSIRFTFYTMEDYKTLTESMGGNWEDGKETWDASDGGLTASTEVRGSDALKSEYGVN